MSKKIKIKILIFSQVYPMKLYVHTTIFFYQVIFFSKVSNNHLCINQNKTKHKSSLKIVEHVH